MQISSDLAGLRRDRHADAMVAALDALSLSDADRIRAIIAYFKALPASSAEDGLSGQ